MTKRVAAIDCGTNSLRLLIADVDPVTHRLTDVQRWMEIVRLGQGVDATGMLAPAALERTLRVLAEYAAEIRSAGATAVRMVATSASRDASNAADFARGVRATLGIDPEVISGQEEATLSFAGATAELAGPVVANTVVANTVVANTVVANTVVANTVVANTMAANTMAGGNTRLEPPFLVVDIGGGSTEFVLGGDDGVAADAARATSVAGISVDIGCVRLTERYLYSDPPTETEIKGAAADIDRTLDAVAAAIDVSAARTLVGLAGSVTTVTAIALGLSEYDPARTHHARISAGAVHGVTQRLLSATRPERAAIGSMHPGRVDVIGAGALVLDRVMQRFGFADVVASEHDILDGIAWSIAGG